MLLCMQSGADNTGPLGDVDHSGSSLTVGEGVYSNWSCSLPAGVYFGPRIANKERSRSDDRKGTNQPSGGQFRGVYIPVIPSLNKGWGSEACGQLEGSEQVLDMAMNNYL